MLLNTETKDNKMNDNQKQFLQFLDDSMVEKIRDNGDKFNCFYFPKNSDWNTIDIASDLHGRDIREDDYRYKILASLISEINKYKDDYDTIENLDDNRDDFINPLQDIYTHDLTAWLNSHSSRLKYCDNAKIDNLGDNCNMTDIISMGQYLEISEIFSNIINLLNEVE